MSKEKNLTFVLETTSSPAIDGTTHTSGKHYRHGRLLTYHIFGPAIDRLHEFEKLGLEPEEIAERIKLCDIVAATHRYPRELVSNLICENDRLKAKIEEITEYSIETNDELASVEEERDRLKHEIEENNLYINNLEMDNRRLEAHLKAGKAFNDGFDKACTELRKENEQLKQKVANFEQSMKLLNDCINERDAEIMRLTAQAVVKDKDDPNFIWVGDEHYISTREHFDRIANYNSRIDELNEENERLQKADPNPILAKERELVGAKCLGLERENARLTQANSRLFVKKMDLEGKVWELNQIIKCHELTIKTLEDKLERIDSVLTEDDE